MADDYRTKHAKKAEGTPFTNGVFVGLLFGIIVSIAVTLFITNGKSPFVSKDTVGACIEVNSALGDEDVINIDEDANIEAYAEPSEVQAMQLKIYKLIQTKIGM